MKKVEAKDLKEILNKRFDRDYFTTSMKSLNDYENIDNLYLYESEENYLILQKREGFYLADLFINRKKPLISLNEDIVVEYPYRRLKKEDEELLADLNFKEIVSRQKLKSTINCNTEYNIIDESFLDEVYSLIIKNYDKYYGCIPNKAELLNRFKNEEIIAIIKDDSVAGFVEFSENKSFKIEHLIINDSFRGQGLAKNLIEQLLGYGHKNNKDIILFVNDNNIAAQKLYESMGFVKDNVKAKVYRREKWKKQ